MAVASHMIKLMCEASTYMPNSVVEKCIVTSHKIKVTSANRCYEYSRKSHITPSRLCRLHRRYLLRRAERIVLVLEHL